MNNTGPGSKNASKIATATNRNHTIVKYINFFRTIPEPLKAAMIDPPPFIIATPIKIIPIKRYAIPRLKLASITLDPRGYGIVKLKTFAVSKKRISTNKIPMPM